MPDNVMTAVKQSVRDETYKKDEVFAPGGASMFLMSPPADSSILPAWGNGYRDYVLRQYARSMYNGLFVSALNNLSSEIASTPFQLYGKRNKDYYHKLLMNAEFGAGWRVFIRKVVSGYGIYDFGVPIEIIGRGDPLKPLTGRVEGIATLDPLYCEVTGNIDYPLIFRSQRGGYHRLHSSRVYRIVDNPQLDRDFYGRGLSALSRYFGIAYLQILMGRYQVEKLSDLPPAGIAIMNNIAGQWIDIMRQYEADRTKDGSGVWRNVVRLENFDRNKDASIEFINFAQLPEQFDYDTYMRHHINLVALALGVDPQDVAPLSGQGLGTGAQSFVLDSKAQRKTPGLILKELETFVNLYVLPPYLEFKFTPRDEEGERQEAETAQLWVNVANSVPGLTDEQKLQLLVAKVQAIQDVATDKAGNILYSDTDVPNTDVVPADDTTTEGTDNAGAVPLQDTEQSAPEGETGTPAATVGAFKYNSAGVAIPQAPVFGYDLEAGVVTMDEARAAKGLPPSEDVPEDELQQLQGKATVMLTLTQAQVPMKSAAEMVGILLPEGTEPPPKPAPFGGSPFPPKIPVVPPVADGQAVQSEETATQKAYPSTRADFESIISGMIDGMVSGDITRIKGGVMMRGYLADYGKRAMLDGLAAGGVSVDKLEGDDLSTYNTWRAEQSAYVADFLNSVFKDGAAPDGDNRAGVWANKSLNGIYQQGLLSADANGLYEWKRGPTSDSCKDCLRLDGQIKRLKLWHSDGLLPQSSELECSGFNCLCTLKRRRKR